MRKGKNLQIRWSLVTATHKEFNPPLLNNLSNILLELDHNNNKTKYRTVH